MRLNHERSFFKNRRNCSPSELHGHGLFKTFNSYSSNFNGWLRKRRTGYCLLRTPSPQAVSIFEAIAVSVIFENWPLAISSHFSPLSFHNGHNKQQPRTWSTSTNSSKETIFPSSSSVPSRDAVAPPPSLWPATPPSLSSCTVSWPANFTLGATFSLNTRTFRRGGATPCGAPVPSAARGGDFFITSEVVRYI